MIKPRHGKDEKYHKKEQKIKITQILFIYSKKYI